jgi:hypothetical protein
MARETLYLVQAFRVGKGKKLTADPPIQCKTSEGARKRAELLADTKAGVVAFATSGDAELGEFDDEPKILFKAGRLPELFEQA